MEALLPVDKPEAEASLVDSDHSSLDNEDKGHSQGAVNSDACGEHDEESTMHISDLPDDCMLAVFSYLSLKQRIGIERVSKQWCILSKRSWSDVKTLKTAAVSAEFKTRKQKRLSGDILASLMSRVTPALTCLDISSFQTRPGCVSEDLISALDSLDLEETNITTLKLRNVRRAGPLIDDNKFDVLDEKLAKVKVIDLSGADFWGDHGIVFMVLNHLRNITDLLIAQTATPDYCLDGCKSALRRLDVTGCECIRKKSLARILLKFEGSLQDLSVSRFQLCSSQGIACPGLKKLTISTAKSTFPSMASEDEDGLFFNFKGTPNLEEFCIVQPAEFLQSPENVTNLKKYCPNLKKLVIAAPEDIEEGSQINWPQSFEQGLRAVSDIQTLEYLDVSFLPLKYDVELHHLTALKNLRKLIMRDRSRHEYVCRLDTDLIQLMNEIPSLTYLDFSGNRLKGYNALDKLLKYITQDGPQLEILIGGCGFSYAYGSVRWLSGRIIINTYNTITDTYGDEDKEEESDSDSDQDDDDDDLYMYYNMYISGKLLSIAKQ